MTSTSLEVLRSQYKLKVSYGAVFESKANQWAIHWYMCLHAQNAYIEFTIGLGFVLQQSVFTWRYLVRHTGVRKQCSQPILRSYVETFSWFPINLRNRFRTVVQNNLTWSHLVIQFVFVHIKGVVRLLSNVTNSLRKAIFPCHSMNNL